MDLKMQQRVKKLARWICPVLILVALVAQSCLIGIMWYSTRLPSPSHHRYQQMENSSDDQQDSPDRDDEKKALTPNESEEANAPGATEDNHEQENNQGQRDNQRQEDNQEPDNSRRHEEQGADERRDTEPLLPNNDPQRPWSCTPSEHGALLTSTNHVYDEQRGSYIASSI